MDIGFARFFLLGYIGLFAWCCWRLFWHATVRPRTPSIRRYPRLDESGAWGLTLLAMTAAGLWLSVPMNAHIHNDTVRDLLMARDMAASGVFEGAGAGIRFAGTHLSGLWLLMLDLAATLGLALPAIAALVWGTTVVALLLPMPLLRRQIPANVAWTSAAVLVIACVLCVDAWTTVWSPAPLLLPSIFYTVSMLVPQPIFTLRRACLSAVFLSCAILLHPVALAFVPALISRCLHGDTPRQAGASLTAVSLILLGTIVPFSFGAVPLGGIEVAGLAPVTALALSLAAALIFIGFQMALDVGLKPLTSGDRHGWLPWAAARLLVVPGVMILAFTLLYQPQIQARYLLPFLPAFSVFVSSLADASRQRIPGLVARAVLLTLILVAGLTTRNKWHADDTYPVESVRAVAEELVKHGSFTINDAAASVHAPALGNLMAGLALSLPAGPARVDQGPVFYLYWASENEIAAGSPGKIIWVQGNRVLRMLTTRDGADWLSAEWRRHPAGEANDQQDWRQLRRVLRLPSIAPGYPVFQGLGEEPWSGCLAIRVRVKTAEEPLILVPIGGGAVAGPLDRVEVAAHSEETVEVTWCRDRWVPLKDGWPLLLQFQASDIDAAP